MSKFKKLDKPFRCPICFVLLDEQLGVGSGPDGKPKPGSVGVCAVCGTPITWTDAMDVRKMNEDDLSRMDVVTAKAMLSVAMERRVRYLQRINNN